MFNHVIVIPARLSSKRLPNKPLLKIDDIPMIIRTCRQCNKAVHKSIIFVVTDSTKIYTLVKKNGFNVMMTSKKCKTGTDRIAEFAKKVKSHLYINIQGDEPIIDPKDIKNFKEALNKNNHKNGFMNAASPGVISAFLPNKFYKNDDEYLENLSNVMKEEYEEITSNGIKLQLDCPDLALARHMTFKDFSENEFLLRAEKQIECLNNAISNIDSSNIRLHICWGNYEGPHLHDIALEKIMPIALKANVQTYLIESSNPRHSHEWQIFENLKIPKDKIIAPGVIDSTTNFVEHPEVVKHRILTYAKVIDIEQLLAGTDCGFSTFAGFGNVDENIVYKKLEALVRGSELASKVI